MVREELIKRLKGFGGWSDYCFDFLNYENMLLLYEEEDVGDGGRKESTG